MVKIGKINRLKVVSESDTGVYLDGGSDGELLLPRAEVPEGCRVGDSLDVFVFVDAYNWKVATTHKPRAAVGEFALLRVVSVSSVGAFLDWGLPKDILVPFREQKNPMAVGQEYLVYVYLDEKTGRIAASSRLDRFLDREAPDFNEGAAVDLIIMGRSDLGYNAIINNRTRGMLYANEVFQSLSTGQRIGGFVKKIRPDGKVDVCLEKPGYGRIDDSARKILERLELEGGFMAVGDNSSPELIREVFGISKKTYKKAAGMLYKKRLITITDEGISLNR